MNEQDHPFSRNAHRSEAGQPFIAGGRRYILMGGVDNGAIGIVRKARDVETQKVVAVKFLAPEFRYIEASSWPDIQERFRREGQKGTALEHDNLVKIIAYEDNENGTCFPEHAYPINSFIVMEFIQGKTLESYIKMKIKQNGEGYINVNKHTLRMAISIADSLVYLHKKNIVHRDIKPANIFLSPEVRQGESGSVKLGDFGVVKWNDFLASINSGTLTMSGQMGLGTLKYMSPEQAMKPKEAVKSCDVYSFGATLLELFSTHHFGNNVQFFLVSGLRRMRGYPLSGLQETGINQIPLHLEELFHLIVNMLAFGPTSRPTMTKIRGRLNFHLQQVDESLNA